VIAHLQISLQCNRLSFERTVWVNAYRNFTFIRPPGPFSSQSVADLELELKTSIDLTENWTSRYPRRFEDRFLDLGNNNMKAQKLKLVRGRYLLVSGESELRCYDLKAPKDEGKGVDMRLIASYDMSKFSAYKYNTFVDTCVDEREHVYDSPLSMVCVVEPSTHTEPKTVAL
jgi:hypothetical protein